MLGGIWFETITSTCRYVMIYTYCALLISFVTAV